MTAGRTVAIIVAAGTGERAGPGIPKQFRRVAGKSLISHALSAFQAHAGIDDVLIAIGAGQQASLAEALDGAVLPAFVTGGEARQDSVLAGLEWIAAHGGAERVLIHDAARPFLPAAVIDRLLAVTGAAIPVLPVVDTLARGDEVLEETVDRASLVRVQTPQVFPFAAILASHRAARGGQATDDAQIARAAGMSVALVEGDAMLEKLTHAADFEAAERRHDVKLTPRTGMGYDVHRLAAGERLWLGGIEIPHDKGLAGHSDADVALHALVDAILGGLADGDIGSHFPPSDPQWRGAASSRFVEYARDRVTMRGGSIAHVDLTIICEAPKIGPHRDAMRARIAVLLGIATDRVSVKATTTERLGFTGRDEGIAAHALATLLLPHT